MLWTQKSLVVAYVRYGYVAQFPTYRQYFFDCHDHVARQQYYSSPRAICHFILQYPFSPQCYWNCFRGHDCGCKGSDGEGRRCLRKNGSVLGQRTIVCRRIYSDGSVEQRSDIRGPFQTFASTNVLECSHILCCGPDGASDHATNRHCRYVNPSESRSLFLHP
jgi:hypothetical protein